MKHSSIGTALSAAHWIALLLWIAIGGLSAAAERESVDGRKVVFSRDELPEENQNAFNMLALLYTLEPVLDSKGEPHDHGHLVQVIVDGGNQQQDPPDADGSPGGDDSLAVGNFNMIVMRGLEEPFSLDGKTGQFFSFKYFVPWVREGVYYLRIWEGDDVKSAPYYQDSSEYRASNGDQGGGMLRMSPSVVQGPIETIWKFGNSTPRPRK